MHSFIWLVSDLHYRSIRRCKYHLCTYIDEIMRSGGFKQPNGYDGPPCRTPARGGSGAHNSHFWLLTSSPMRCRARHVGKCYYCFLLMLLMGDIKLFTPCYIPAFFSVQKTMQSVRPRSGLWSDFDKLGPSSHPRALASTPPAGDPVIPAKTWPYFPGTGGTVTWIWFKPWF